MDFIQFQVCAVLLLVYIKRIYGNLFDSSNLFGSVYYPGMKNSFFEDEADEVEIPRIHRYYTARGSNSKFTGHVNATYVSYASNKPDPEVINNFSYETLTLKSGKRVETKVTLKSSRTNSSSKKNDQKKRRKRKRSKRTRRNVYGRDDRSYIPMTDSLGLAEPYSYTVKISTGCTGIVISPRHVLTAAHCIHDQKDYVTESKKLQVGFFNESKSIHWVDVKQLKVSDGWVKGGQKNGPFFDYALIKLKRKHDKPWIQLAISEQGHHGTGERISFNSFDDDKPKDTMWYRSCSIIEDDKSFLYHYCDAKPGSSGSGVYTWVYDNETHQWNRQLIGVFSGNRWKIYDQFYIIVKNFNVAVRLTAARYAQVCEWLGPKYSNMVCKKGKKKIVNNVVSRK